MSEEVGKSPPRYELSEDEILQFFEEKVLNYQCHACGSESWTIINNQENEIALIAVSKKGTFKVPFQHVQVLGMSCDNCGYVRFHTLGTIATWKAQKKGQ